MDSDVFARSVFCSRSTVAHSKSMLTNQRIFSSDKTFFVRHSLCCFVGFKNPVTKSIDAEKESHFEKLFFPLTIQSSFSLRCIQNIPSNNNFPFEPSRWQPNHNSDYLNRNNEKRRNYLGFFFLFFISLLRTDTILVWIH